MSQAEALASHWVLLFFLGLLNKYMLAWSLDYASVERSSARQNYIHRTWSEWSLWSACSRTCGGGVKMRTRVCKISRLFGVSFETNACVGETVEYELCSIHNCSPYDKEFLEYQCSLRDGQFIGGTKIEEWIPYQYGKHPCELQCWSKDRTLVHSFGKVIDGTKCATSDPKQPALCINGRCTPVDCAGQIGYDNKLDKCGVCRGDNSTCIHYKDVFWTRPRTRTSYDDHKDHHYDYEKIALIPAGATEITIKESSETNFLALMDHKGNYQVNGNWRIQSPGRFFFHGAEFLYNRTWDGEESLSSLGPIRFDISIYVLGSGDIPTVHYEYWISSNNPFKPAQPFQTMNQIKHTHIYENKTGGSKYSQPENNHIHDDSSAKKQVIPVTRFQGYKSYYHRNEILNSVPSWSIKRHRTHKNNLNKYIHTQSDISTSVRRDNADVNPRFVQLESQKRASTPPTENDVAVTAGLLDKDENLFNSRAYNNRENVRVLQSHNRSHVTPVHRTINFERSTEIAPLSNRNRYDLKQRNVTSTVSPLRKKKFDNFGRNTEEYGRTTTTLVQPRSFNYHRVTPVTLQPNLSEQENDAKSKNGNRKRKSSDKQKHEKKRRKSENSECLPCSKPKHQKKSFCTSDFVLRAVVLSSERQEDSYRYELQISQSYKNKVPISPREYIWSIDTCRCPKLRAGKEYIIMGYSGTSGNKRESRLLINRNSFVRKYTQKRARTMLRLVRDQNSICRQFE